MKQKSPVAIQRQKVVELGLDPDGFDLTSQEAIAAALRRVARFLCPCPGMSLVRAVTKPLRGLIENLEETKARVENILEAMVSHGDLLEFREFYTDQARGRILLFAAPLSFIPRDTGAQILVGIPDDQASELPEDLISRINHVGHTRHLNPTQGENLREILQEHGLLEIPFDNWVKKPQLERPAALIARYDAMLDSGRPSGEVPGLQLLDPESPVNYYRGRWIEPRKQFGCFVARRKQAYGAPLWSYVRVRDGEPEALVDLPLSKNRWRGCDEAWHLQMAIDASRGHPQRLEIRAGPDHTRIMAFFSPVPMWAQRRWDTVGKRIENERCLFAYQIAKDELPQEIEFIRQALWLDQLANGG